MKGMKKIDKNAKMILSIITTTLIIAALVLTIFLILRLKNRVKVKHNKIDKIVSDLDSLSNYLNE